MQDRDLLCPAVYFLKDVFILKKSKIASLGLAAAAIGVAVKKKGACIPCLIKRGASAVKINADTKGSYNNGVALTPPMGWSSWNLFRHNINEELIYDTAKAMKESGLADCGYTYVNLDDCWQSSMRDKDGKMTGDFSRFPSGIKALAEKVNALGLKLGIYSSNGTLTCEDLPAGLGNEAIDADTFAEWGIEYLKYDFCHNKAIPTRAPDIDKISISKTGSSDETVIQAEEGQLFGSARIEEDSKLSTGKFVTGLCSGKGKLYFPDIRVDESGDYVLTVGIRKNAYCEKYLEVKVNDKDIYSTTLPATQGWTHEGRNQIIIHLNEGSNTLIFYNPIGSRFDSSIKQYTTMGKELKRASKEYAEKTGKPEKKIVYSICEWGMNFPYKWGASAGNLWRTTMDIKAFWASIVGIYEINVRLWKHAHPGAWNDPDMLEVGNGNLTYDENVSHFSLWCMMAAPLMLGNDLRDFIVDGKVDTENKYLKLLTNKKMIGIDQDKLGKQCQRVYTNGLVDILAKPLEGHKLAVCFFNKSSETKTVKAEISKFADNSYLDFNLADAYKVENVWDEEDFVSSNDIIGTVPSHGVKVYIIEGIKD